MKPSFFLSLARLQLKLFMNGARVFGDFQSSLSRFRICAFHFSPKLSFFLFRSISGSSHLRSKFQSLTSRNSTSSSLMQIKYLLENENVLLRRLFSSEKRISRHSRLSTLRLIEKFRFYSICSCDESSLMIRHKSQASIFYQQGSLSRQCGL